MLLFTENETNVATLVRLARTLRRSSRMRFTNYVVDGKREAVNPSAVGTKARAALRA